MAALKLRTTNTQGRHLSTQRAIELLEEHGVESAEGLVKTPPGVLHRGGLDCKPLQLARLRPSVPVKCVGCNKRSIGTRWVTSMAANRGRRESMDIGL